MKKTFALLMLTLTACGGHHTVAPVVEKSYSIGSKISAARTRLATLPLFYKVKKGDTLYAIGWRYGLHYKTLADNNNISPPYKIKVGQRLKIRPHTKTAKKKVANIPQKRTNQKHLSNERLTWRWPVEGKVISTYSKNAAGRKGIDIAGRSGQSIVSAAKGKVVYSGNGLPRYGNLLIIKHNEVYLSAYAHNKSLLVKEGDAVKAGQKIATLGRTGARQDKLHFEIRYNGKPLNPLKFLPKR